MNFTVLGQATLGLESRVAVKTLEELLTNVHSEVGGPTALSLESSVTLDAFIGADTCRGLSLGPLCPGSSGALASTDSTLLSAMLIQILLACEGLVARGALEFLLISVHFEVPNKIALNCKGHVTLIAFERLLTTVQSEVVIQLELGREGLATFRAFERFLATVHTEMVSQSGLGLQVFFTHCAFVHYRI